MARLTYEQIERIAADRARDILAELGEGFLAGLGRQPRAIIECHVHNAIADAFDKAEEPAPSTQDAA